MASPQESVSMALFCDFENVALGVRDANYEKFDIKPILERLLLKGSIVVKKAYCDWDRYKGFKATMHEASFELIEIPHKRQSGKNSADIRLVVDALDLCYTKLHVDTFVIISGDSDFSPLVSKLRENAKKVIGVGVKNSTSDLLVANCDEFIFYDDLVREEQRAIAKREAREAREAAAAVAAAAVAQSSSAPANSGGGAKRPADDEKSQSKQEIEARKSKAFAIAVETFDALVAERGDQGKIWASVLKNAIKRRKPDFSESYYGFRAFGSLLDEAQARGLLEVGRDEKSGAFVFRSNQSAGTDAASSGAVSTPQKIAPFSEETTDDSHEHSSRMNTGSAPASSTASAPTVSGASASMPSAATGMASAAGNTGVVASEQDAPRESSRSRSRRASRQKMRERAIDAARQSPPISEQSNAPGVGSDSADNTVEAAHVADDLEAAVSGRMSDTSDTLQKGSSVPAPTLTTGNTADAANTTAIAETQASTALPESSSKPSPRSSQNGPRAGRQGRRLPPSQAFGAPYQTSEAETHSGGATGTTTGGAAGTAMLADAATGKNAQVPLFDTAADSIPVSAAVGARDDAFPPKTADKPSPARRARTAAAKKAAQAEADAASMSLPGTEAPSDAIEQPTKRTGFEASSGNNEDAGNKKATADNVKPARAPRKSVASTRRARTGSIVITDD